MFFRKKILLVMLLVLGTIITGCDSLFYDDMSDCPQGVYVKFHSKTPCAQDSSFIGNVSNLYLFAYDERDVLAGSLHLKNVSLTQDYKALMKINEGVYTFEAWTGLDNELFSVYSFKDGVTTKNDLMMTLRTKQKNQTINLDTHRVWQGSSPIVSMPSAAAKGSVFKYTEINLQEKTNRINVEVSLHESVLNGLMKKAQPQDFVVEISSANTAMNFNGSIAKDSQVMSYPAKVNYSKNSLYAAFTLMDLQTGYNSMIIIRDKKNDEIVWKGDLIGSILLKIPNANLTCQKDFTIKFDIRDKCLGCGTYICWAIYVDGWQVHSYQLNAGEDF